MGGDPRPIGIFDSGVGGFSVLDEMRRLLPNESVVYVADHRYAPYGGRSLEDVADRAIQISGQLIEAGAKLIAVACNSASAAALFRLRAMYPDTPFVGMEPAVKPAALHSRSGVVGVLATSATFQGELFSSVVDRHANGVTVIPIVGSGLADLVELGEEQEPAAKELLDGYLAPALDAGMDTLVLGCTHYSYLQTAIASIAGDAVTIVDPAPAVARHIGRLLVDHKMASPGDADAQIVLATTGELEQLTAHAERLMHVVDAVVRRW